MSKYDADARRQAMERPVITIGGRTVEGEILSMDQMEPLIIPIARIATAPWSEQRETIRHFFDLTFPPRATWKFWRWSLPVSWHVLRLSPAEMWETFNFFCRRLAEANGYEFDLAGEDKSLSHDPTSSPDSSESSPASTTAPDDGQPAME